MFGLFTVEGIRKSKSLIKRIVYPIGLPIGLYLKTQGVMIIDSGKIENKDGKEMCPAEGKFMPGNIL